MKHYIAVLSPLPEGGWRAHFPDLPACRADGDSSEAAISLAASKAAEAIREMKLNGGPPHPRSLEEIHADHTWALKQSLDWKSAVVRLVPVAGSD
jgi:predicted RNase H-like HicB family nuclease